MLCGAGCCTELLKVTHLALKSLIDRNESRVSADVNKTAFDLMQYFFVPLPFYKLSTSVWNRSVYYFNSTFMVLNNKATENEVKVAWRTILTDMFTNKSPLPSWNSIRSQTRWSLPLDSQRGGMKDNCQRKLLSTVFSCGILLFAKLFLVR